MTPDHDTKERIKSGIKLMEDRFHVSIRNNKKSMSGYEKQCKVFLLLCQQQIQEKGGNRPLENKGN